MGIEELPACTMVPIQVPGGPELLIIGLILLILVAFLSVIVAGIVFLSRRSSKPSAPAGQRVAELERRVEELENQDESETDRTDQQE